MNNELQEFLLTKHTVSPETIKNYIKQYNRLYLLLGNLQDCNELEIIRNIENISKSPNSQSLYLNVPIMIRKMNNKPTDLLVKMREDLKKKIKDYTKNEKDKLNLTLPGYDIINNFIKDLYNEGLYKNYVINYLILKYGVRNKDINVFITENESLIDNIHNFLIVNKTTITWIRNDYKTVKTYGKKIIKIRSRQFIKAVNNLEMNTFLISGNIEDENLHNKVKSYLYDGLTEGDYFKINILHVQKSKTPLASLKELSEYRGTSLECINQSYNCLTL